MSDLTSMSVRALSKMLESKEISSEELTISYLERIASLDRDLSAYITVTADPALCAAKESDKRRKRSESLGVLDGIPFSVKDNFCTKGIKTTAGSRMLENYIPPYTATAIRRLTDKGCVLLGKTNMDEFGMGSLCMNSYFGPSKNPADKKRATGGSSGGSASSVAASMAAFSIASDTGGSIRLPAALCGVVGFKPAYGAVSRYGLTAFSPSLDTVGVISRDVSDCDAVYSVICGRDEKDATSIDVKRNKKSADRLAVGIISELIDRPLDSTVRSAIQKKISNILLLGADSPTVSIPLIERAAECYYIISSCEASSTLSRFDGVRYGYRADDVSDIDELYRSTRSSGFGREVKKRIMLGSFALSSGYYDRYYRRALLYREALCREFDRAFEKFDLLVAPVYGSTAPLLSDPPSAEKLYQEDIFTTPASLAGLPSISIPCQAKSELPIGIQILCKKGDEDILFSFSKTLLAEEGVLYE